MLQIQLNTLTIIYFRNDIVPNSPFFFFELLVCKSLSLLYNLEAVS